MKRLNLYFNEYNLLMGKAAYLPLSSGLLHSYLETDPKLADAVKVFPYLFHRDTPQRILEQYREAPDVAAFSVSMWNESLSLEIAKTLKQRHPGVLIVFGGPQVPFQSNAYLTKHPFIDVAVRSEGELAFAAVLSRFLESRDFQGIPSVTYRHPNGSIVRVEASSPQVDDLDRFPSPYLTGKYDGLLRDHPEFSFQAIIETNRGCPFNCTFCYWGQGGLSTKYRFFSMDRIRAQVEWIARNKIEYVFNADSNFGMLPRDMDIAVVLVETKKKFGFPQKFRSCYGKNSDEKIFRISKLLSESEMLKSVTLARQSNDEQTLENIGRKNIKLSTFQSL
ncbi:MAG: cobalamin-dependent protein [Spirochaetes bacterium]|nr:cobalamin-dependent protein [Spirochaetota bacterium]